MFDEEASLFDIILNKDEIEKCLIDKKYKIINVIKCINYSFGSDGIPYKGEESMDNIDIKRIFVEINEKLVNKKILTFLIFNEYFFSFHDIISNDNFNLILDLSKEKTCEFKNLVIIVNLLHSIDSKSFTEKDIEKYISDCMIYFSKISDKENNILWKISSHNFKDIFNKRNKKYYANESFVIMRKNILYKYKKSSYYEELTKIGDTNYIIGFGEDEINFDLKDDLLEIAKVLSKNISIEICFDLQTNIKAKTFDNAMIDEEIDKEIPQIKELKLLRKNVENYDTKQLIIIQSNTTDIYEQINIFPLNKIISKCDPIQQMVFTLNNKMGIKELKFSESYNKDQIEYEKMKGEVPDSKKKRLNNYLSKLNYILEKSNVHKLIFEFKSVVTNKNLGNHLILFCEYDYLQNKDSFNSF